MKNLEAPTDEEIMVIVQMVREFDLDPDWTLESAFESLRMARTLKEDPFSYETFTRSADMHLAAWKALKDTRYI